MAGPAQAPACAMVIFGVRGDLAKRLLVPALYNLHATGLLSDDFRIIGVDHGDNDDAGIRHDLKAFLQEVSGAKDSPLHTDSLDAGLWSWLEERISYQVGDFEDDAAYATLAATLRDQGVVNALFYMAVAPRFFTKIAEGLAKAKLLEGPPGGFRRVVVEKPFGEDLPSAQALNEHLRGCMNENQIFRIDHFLGKEMVRNIMVTRFSNDIFEPLWNRTYIDSVQITAAETVGVEGRGSFYDRTGALRDMTPNHLCQLLGMLAMEPPRSLGAEAVRAEKGRVIQAIRRFTVDQARSNMAAGQYDAGRVGGHEVVSYRSSENVSPDSRTETFIALKLEIDNARWEGVPFYLRTGKAMSTHETQIAIHFKTTSSNAFRDACYAGGSPNVLLMKIQPDQGISLLMDAKQPGPDVELAPVTMDFRYVDHFQSRPGTGYESLVYDVMVGDQTLFSRGEDIEAGWAAVAPFQEALKDGAAVDLYAAGTDGPTAAETLLTRDGRAWRSLHA